MSAKESSKIKDNNNDSNDHKNINKKKSPRNRVTKKVKDMTLDELRKSKGFRELGDMLYID